MLTLIHPRKIQLRVNATLFTRLIITASFSCRTHTNDFTQSYEIHFYRLFLLSSSAIFFSLLLLLASGPLSVSST